jgi:hypothetical protein
MAEAIMINHVNSHVDANRLGIVGGVVLAGWHVVWLVLHATGLGQRVTDFVFRMHGLKSDVVVEPFEPGMAALLVLTTALTGYVFMSVSGLLWNCLGSVCARSGSGVTSRA